MVYYRIKVKNKNDVEIGEFTTFKDLKFGKRLNNFGIAEFKVPWNDSRASTLVNLRKNSIWIYRVEDTVEQLVWSGEQFYRHAELSPDQNNWVTIFAYDWLEQLNHKFTAASVSYSQVDAGQIFLDLIDGAYGITEGTIIATKLRDRTYNNQNVLEAGINLTNVIDGFDMEINNYKKLNIKPTIGTDRSDSIIFEYGINVSDATIDEDFTNPVNRAIVLGQADDTGELVRQDVNDLDSQESIGLREQVDTELDISEVETFEDKGLGLIQKYKLPLVGIQIALLSSVRPHVIDFAIGDTVRLIINSGIYEIDEKSRIFEYECEFRPDNTEQLSVTLSNFTL